MVRDSHVYPWIDDIVSTSGSDRTSENVSYLGKIHSSILSLSLSLKIESRLFYSPSRVEPGGPRGLLAVSDPITLFAVIPGNTGTGLVFPRTGWGTVTAPGKRGRDFIGAGSVGNLTFATARTSLSWTTAINTRPASITQFRRM